MAVITGFKVALCLSYLRILKQSNRLYIRIVWFIMISCSVFHLAGTLVLIFQCSPVSLSMLARSLKLTLPGQKIMETQHSWALSRQCKNFLVGTSDCPIGIELVDGVASSASIIDFCSANIEQFPFGVQLNPKGQHPNPQVSISLERSVVLMRLSGWAVAFCCSMSQEIGLCSEQSLSVGQQRIVKLAPKDKQTVSAGQQKLLGSPA
jgi:hypothetical protein